MSLITDTYEMSGKCQNVTPALNGFPLSGLFNSREKRDAARNEYGWSGIFGNRRSIERYDMASTEWSVRFCLRSIRLNHAPTVTDHDCAATDETLFAPISARRRLKFLPFDVTYQRARNRW